MSAGPPDVPLAVVADDDGVTRRMLSLLLERQGFRVQVAVDGSSALDLVRGEVPRLLFLDANMPAPDGFEVCRIVRRELSAASRPHIVMITAAGQDLDRQRAIDAGVDEFVTKPFSPSRLSTHIRSFLE